MKSWIGFPIASVFSLVALILVAGIAAADEPTPEQKREELPGGILDKPYLVNVGQGASVGGYFDMEFERNGDGSNTFDQHRFVPFITGHVSERVTVSAEIEFEHGGKVPGEGEVKLEYAIMDFLISEGLQFRGGVLLSPLGSFNLLHDSPLNDLTERPLVTRQLIPTTLSESGMGFFGTFYPGEESVLAYEAYLVNGFNEGILKDGKLRVRNGRGSQKNDNNEDKSLAARLGWSPWLGSNLGVSVHSGKYDDLGEQNLTITAGDLKWTRGPLEVQGEVAGVRADIDRTAYPTAASSQLGAYGQINFHFLHDAVLDGSVWTAVVRGDWVDYDRDTDGDSEEGLTLGINFRPTEETVFKLDYNWATPTAPDGIEGPRTETLFFSLATYF